MSGKKGSSGIVSTTIDSWVIFRELTLRGFLHGDSYRNSNWYNWEERIKVGHKKEMEWLEDISKRWSDENYDFGEVYADDYFQAISVTNSMYAALVVSLWAEIEQFLKAVIRKAYKKKHIKKDTPFAYPKMEKAINDTLNIDINLASEYVTINAIRQLNNIFKHNDGYCNGDGLEYSDVTSSSLTTIAIPSPSNASYRRGMIKVEYAELPFEKLVEASHTFVLSILNEIEQNRSSK